MLNLRQLQLPQLLTAVAVLSHGRLELLRSR